MSRQKVFLKTVEVDWPRLSWVALLQCGRAPIHVFHGSGVEANPAWCVEAVWAGEYTDGDFDKADLVFGTGVRVRDDEVVFVSSGDTLNRLHYYKERDFIYVSNSFTAIIAVADLDLVNDFDYADALASIMRGLSSHEKVVPSTRGSVHLIYYRNFKVKDHEITITDKASTAPDFPTFSRYRDYILDSADGLRRNAAAIRRRHTITPLATISSGYDSAAAALPARAAGATEAVTIEQGRRTVENLFRLNDSGKAVAEQLGLNCTTYSRFMTNYPFEDAGWASMGNIGDINLAIFDYPQPLCLLFTGFMGDVMWATDTVQPEALRRKDTSGARFNEIRLELGVFVCSPAFWGCQKESQILRLTHQPEMRPWTLGNKYDRPIPRRLLEEAGVQRDTFGRTKRVATFNRRYGRPLSADLRSDFSAFLERRGKRAGSRLAEAAALGLAGLDWMVLRRLPPPLGWSCRDWVRLPTATEFFLWATERRRQRFLKGLELLEPPAGSTGAFPSRGRTHRLHEWLCRPR